jgi:hypothetical protein
MYYRLLIAVNLPVVRLPVGAAADDRFVSSV